MNRLSCLSTIALLFFGLALPAFGQGTTVTIAWGDADWAAWEFQDNGPTYDGFDTRIALPGTGDVAPTIGERGEDVYGEWIDYDISTPVGFTSADLSSATIDVIIYQVTVTGTLDFWHLSSPANNPALLGDFEYNDDPTLALTPPATPVAGYSLLGNIDIATFDTLETLVVANYSGGAAAFAAGNDPDQGPFLGMTRDDVLDASTVSIALDLATVRGELDGDGSLSLLLGTSFDPYSNFDGPGGGARDHWEFAATGGGVANTYGILGASGRDMELNLTFVPEPGSALLIAVGMGLFVVRRRR